MGLENLPSTYFGALPPLTRDVHPYAEGLTVLNGTAPVAIPIEDVVAVEVGSKQCSVYVCNVWLVVRSMHCMK